MGIYRGQVQDIPCLPIRVSLPLEESRFLRRTGRMVPAAVVVTVIVATGSKRSSLRPRILQELHCPRRSTVQVQTSTGRGAAAFYLACIEFPASTLKPLPRALVAGLGMPQNLTAYDGVIGGTFWVDGKHFTAVFENN
jgi:hypothetical protein